MFCIRLKKQLRERIGQARCANVNADVDATRRSPLPPQPLSLSLSLPLSMLEINIGADVAVTATLAKHVVSGLSHRRGLELEQIQVMRIYSTIKDVAGSQR